MPEIYECITGLSHDIHVHQHRQGHSQTYAQLLIVLLSHTAILCPYAVTSLHLKEAWCPIYKDMHVIIFPNISTFVYTLNMSILLY